MFLDYMKLSLHSIRSRRLRSWLTILGIVIGVTAVVALIAIAQGMQQSVKKQFEAIGYDTIMVYPGGSFGGPEGGEGRRPPMMGMFGGDTSPVALNLGILERSPQVAKFGYLRTETGIVRSAGMAGQGFLRVTGLSEGVTEKFSGYFGEFPLAEGRKFGEGDRFAVILGNQVADDLGVGLGGEITIEAQSFQVIGILADMEERGGGIGFHGLSNALFVPISALEALYEQEGTISMALVEAAEGADVAKVAEQVKMILSQGGTPVSTMTAEEISKQVSNVLGTMQMTLAAIAAISLLVGGVGVMNTMYTSVLERTREIGIMKAVGAKNRHVLNLFLIESGLMGIIGGIIGILLGVVVSGVASRLMGGMLSFGPMGGDSFSASFSPGLIIGALAFSFALGAISGTFPARRAAKLRPVEALRYE
jgi:putative ABC transport system permease protein